MKKAEYNLFIPISREWALNRFMYNLNNVRMPRNNINLSVYLDSDDLTFYNKITSAFSKMQDRDPFASAECHISLRKPVGENILERRQRIIEIWGYAQNMLSEAPYTFGLEDDTTVPVDAFGRLSKLIRNPEVGYVQGLQMHRQCSSVGAWKKRGKVFRTMSQEELKENVVKVDGGGFYCFMTKTFLIKQAIFRQSGPAFGPDVCFVRDVKSACYQTLTDTRVKCGHMMDKNTIIYPNKYGVLKYGIVDQEEQIPIES